MHPILFEWGPLTLRSYGLLVAAGFLAGLWVFQRTAQKSGLDKAATGDFAFVIFLSGLIGARVAYVLLNWPEYSERPWAVFKIWEGGLIFYGGLIAALGGGLWFARRRNLPAWSLADAAALGLPLAHSLGRVGCFLAGCCYGKPTSLPWGVVFQDPQSLAPLGLKVHPVQLYEALGNLAIFGSLSILAGKKRSPGFLAGFYLALYAILRFTLEFLRGDDRGMAAGLFTSQWIAIVALGFGLFLIEKKSRNTSHGGTR